MRSSSMMAAMSMLCGQRVVHVSQPVHSQMKRLSTAASTAPICTARMIWAGCRSPKPATGQPVLHFLHW